MTTDYRKGTRLNASLPWGINIRRGTRALCSDGRVRSVAYLAQTADTFFSIPAAVRVKGRYITGYVTTEETECGGPALCFRQHTPNDGTLPAWPERYSDEWKTLLTE